MSDITLEQILKDFDNIEIDIKVMHECELDAIGYKDADLRFYAKEQQKRLATEISIKIELLKTKVEIYKVKKWPWQK